MSTLVCRESVLLMKSMRTADRSCQCRTVRLTLVKLKRLTWSSPSTPLYLQLIEVPILKCAVITCVSLCLPRVHSQSRPCTLDCQKPRITSAHLSSPHGFAASANQPSHGGPRAGGYGLDKTIRTRSEGPHPHVSPVQSHMGNTTYGSRDSRQGSRAAHVLRSVPPRGNSVSISAEIQNTSHLTRGDLRINNMFAVIVIRHRKTLQKSGQTRRVQMAKAPDGIFCPVKTLQKVPVETPTRSTEEPLLMFPDTRTPMPMSYIKKAWSAALKTVGADHPSITLHSLRKTAATQALSRSCQEIEIQRFGGWRSAAHRVYMLGQVAPALIKLLSSPLVANFVTSRVCIYFTTAALNFYN